MVERIPIILNPAARSTKAARIIDCLQSLKPEPELYFTERVGHATEIAERLAREGRELVVAAGGDGTVNEVLQGLCKVNAERPDVAAHTTLGTLPAGTMNVFAYEIGYTSHRQLDQPWQLMTGGARREVDLWLANDHYFVQLAGVGLDAEVVRQTTWQMKERFGPLSYAISALNTIRQMPEILSVQIPGRPDLRGSQVLIGNGRHYGGAFQLFRDAKLSDGLLDVVIVRGRFNAWEAAQILRGALLDGYHESEDIDYLQLNEFRVNADVPTAMQVDGEVCGTTPVTFKKAPFVLRVAAGAESLVTPATPATARTVAAATAGLARSATPG